MPRSARLLPAAALAVTLAALAPAHAEPFCEDVGGSTGPGAGTCVSLLEDERTYACASGWVDPLKNTVDDVVGGYVCLADIGEGLQPYTCFYTGRRYILCGR